jgi:hypothetical protein
VGTHVYLAVASEGSGANLRWLSASLAASPQARPRTDAKALMQGQRVAARSQSLEDTAARALDRFELPGEARRFIAERLWVGASLIVSDEGISNETGTYTDFIVLTR